jgi:hypothetical protein
MSLEQRSRLSGIGHTTSHRRHCWVTGPADDPGPWAGLILDWQHTEAGWRAWVVYLIGPDHEVAVQGWVERDRLAPAW